MLTAVRVTSHLPAASGRVGGHPRYEDVPACRPGWLLGGGKSLSSQFVPSFFVRQTQLGAKCSEPVRPRAANHRLPSTLPSRQGVEIFFAIRMRKKYYRLAGCLDRICLAGYIPAGDGRETCLLLFRSHPARRRSFRPTGQTYSVKAGRGNEVNPLLPLHLRQDLPASSGGIADSGIPAHKPNPLHIPGCSCKRALYRKLHSGRCRPLESFDGFLC